MRNTSVQSTFDKEETEASSVAEAIDASPNAPLGSQAGLTVSQFWIAIAGINAGMLLTALDFNIIATAVPRISAEFNTYEQSSWLGTSFLIAFAASLLIWGKLGDCAGRKEAFLGATILFGVGSALCGWATGMEFLIGARVVQGIGAGGIYPLTFVIITDLVDLKRAGRFVSVVGALWAVADIAGPLLGGVFTQFATWRWCFWINLIIAPFSFVAVLLALKLPHDRPAFRQTLRRFDYSGGILVAGGSVLVLIGLSWGGQVYPWTDGKVLGTIVGGVGALGAFVACEKYALDPLVMSELFGRRDTVAIFVAQFFFGMNLLGSQFYLPQYFQLVFGDASFISGVGLIPLMLGVAIGGPIAAWLSEKFGRSLWSAIGGGCLAILTTGLMTRWNAQTSRAETVVVLLLLGIGQGLILTGLLLSVQVAVQPPQIGAATSLSIFTQALGDVMAIAIFAALYGDRVRNGLHTSLGLPESEIQSILDSPLSIRQMYKGDMAAAIVSVYANSMQRGWWLLFAAAVALTLSACCSRQHQFTKT